MYESMGLAKNPFAYGADGLDPGSFSDHMQIAPPQPSQGQFLQLLGDRGVGKSTHLRHWHATVGGDYCHVAHRNGPELPIGPLVYWDEVDRLPKRRIRRSLQAAASISATVVVGTHRDLAPLARSIGLIDATVCFEPIEVDVLARWTQARIERVKLAETGFGFPPDVLRAIATQAGPSMRTAGDLAHIWVARQARGGHNMSMEHLTTEQLDAGLDHIRKAPSELGTVEMIVRRPDTDQREVLDIGQLVVGEGLAGDNYRARGNAKTPDGAAHPEAQINIMRSRAIDVICSGDRDMWKWAGDQLFIDFDISETNAPPGTKLQIGEALLEVSEKPHTGCAKFSARFGKDAVLWVNSPEGKQLKLRGINATVVTAGAVKPGDSVVKL